MYCFWLRKTQYLCEFTLDYYNATPTRKRQVSTETCRFQLYSPYGELYAPSVRDICFASDMPAGVRGEYNITETVGFNITFCVAKYITPSKTEYH